MKYTYVCWFFDPVDSRIKSRCTTGLAGLVFGEDFLQLPMIESPEKGTRNVYSWPLVSIIYNTIRTNSNGDRLRAGATCEHIRQTIDYFDW